MCTILLTVFGGFIYSGERRPSIHNEYFFLNTRYTVLQDSLLAANGT